MRAKLALVLVPVLCGAAAGCFGAVRAPAVRGLPPDPRSASLSVVWIGHATVLLRLGEQQILTDPNLNGALAILPRNTPASLRPAELPFVDVAIVSHLHLDHFDRWTMRQLRPATAVLLPEGGGPYAGSLPQTCRQELGAWETTSVGGLEITAVPVSHFGGRYGIDALWNHAYTGYVIEGAGHRVFFAGDTGWHPELFKEVGRRFPGIELAFVPIAPNRAGSLGSAIHANPAEALAIATDVGAAHVIPIHYEAYYATESSYDRPRQELLAAAGRAGLGDRVHALRVGERWQLPAP